MIYTDISQVPPLSYDMIMADCPWRFKTYSEKGNTKSASSKYKTMTTQEIADLPVGQIAARDAVLWLWAVNPMLREAFTVMDAWGFEFKTAGHWGKYNRETDKIAFGTGYRLRAAGEPYLIGIAGNPKTSRSVRSLILAPALRHSQKPEEAYEDAEKMLPNAMRRIELFSRTPREGWDVMGDELQQGETNV